MIDVAVGILGREQLSRQTIGDGAEDFADRLNLLLEGQACRFFSRENLEGKLDMKSCP